MQGVDQTTKKVVCALLRNLLSSFNGLVVNGEPLTTLLRTEKCRNKVTLEPALLQAYGDPDLKERSVNPEALDVLNYFNERMLELSCEYLFVPNCAGFDGTSLCKSFIQCQVIFLCIQM